MYAEEALLLMTQHCEVFLIIIQGIKKRARQGMGKMPIEAYSDVRRGGIAAHDTALRSLLIS